MEESRTTPRLLCIISKNENRLKEFAIIVNNLIITKYFSAQVGFSNVPEPVL